MNDLLQTVILFAGGAVAGSFLNVVILRAGLKISNLPATLTGRSQCPACGKQLSAGELIPIVSWLAQAGRCRTCQATISPQYPLVELACGLLAVAIVSPAFSLAGLTGLAGTTTLAVLDFVAALLLLILFVVDLKSFLLPDKFLWPLGAVTFAHAIVQITNHESRITAPPLGALIGAGFLLLLWLSTRGRGIGLGDVKLMIPLGLRFGPLGTSVLLFIAFMVGGAYGSVLLAARRATMKTAIPFGPFLIGAALLLMLTPHLPGQLLALLGWPP